MTPQFFLLILLLAVHATSGQSLQKDGCPSELWRRHNNHCYRVMPGPPEGISADQSERLCRESGAHLVSIHSAEEQEFITSEIRAASKNTRQYFWIGLHLEHAEPSSKGVLSAKWVDGSVMDYANPAKSTAAVGQRPWTVGEPSNTWKDENCTMVYGWDRGSGREVGRWSDIKCSTEMAGFDGVYWPIGFICKMAAAADIVPSTTVATTITTTTRAPATTPAQPLPKSECPKGWTEWRDWCYQVNPSDDDGVTADEGEAACEREGGHLASIHSAEEQDFVEGQIRSAVAAVGASATKKFFWIGLEMYHTSPSDVASAKWSDHSPVDYGNPVGLPSMDRGRRPWAAGEPYNHAVSQQPGSGTTKCAMIYGFGAEPRHQGRKGVMHAESNVHFGRWNDMACDVATYWGTSAGFVCKREPLRPKCPGDRWNQWEGSCYLVVPGKGSEEDGHSFASANSQCEKEGGNLVSIHSEDEQGHVSGGFRADLQD